MKTIQKSDFFKVLISAIVVEEGFNVRKDMGDIDALAQSIAAIGQQVPIIATKVRGEDAFKLTSGHRRLEAIKLANKKYGAKITHVNIMGATGDEKSRVLTMLLDGEGAKKLTAAEMASGFKRLKEEHGMKPQDIGKAVGLSQAQVYNILAVNKAPEAIQKMIEEGEISVALVNEIQRTTKDADEQVKLAEEAVANAEQEKKKKATSSNAKTSKVSADIAKLEAAIALSDPTVAKVATLKAIVNKLKSKASAEEIAKLLK
jgi:ParB family transcriptional regulator, chromosome partitioning protein